MVLDATAGLGGHAEAMLERIGPRGRLIAMDRDAEALEQARIRLKRFGDQVEWMHGPFGDLNRMLAEHGIDRLDAALFDLGVSSLQLEEGRRGFSFQREGPLDMRMNPEDSITAADLVNRLSQGELQKMLQDLGQERWAGRIARAIMRTRPIFTTGRLADVVGQAVPGLARHGRIHPATRTFQALRIAVNHELEQLPEGLAQAADRLNRGGRVAVLAYHSLEDRIVKVYFRDQAKAGVLRVLTRKPLKPSLEEVQRNPRSRSACLRAAERL